MRLTDDSVPSALLFIAFAALALCIPPQNDTWWHLRAGHEMIEAGGILTAERFSHNPFGAPLHHNPEWLTQLLFYGLFVAGGPWLLALFCGACVIGAIAGAWRLVQGSWEVRFAFLLLMMAGVVAGWAIRPQVVSLALFVLAIHLVVKERDEWLPLLCLVWSNMHGVATVGVVIACCSAIEAIVWSRDRVRRAILVAAACALAPMAMPLGWHSWPQVVQVAGTARALEIQESQSSFEVFEFPFGLTVIALALVVALKGRSIAQETRDSRVLVLIALVFAIAGALSVRNVPLFFIVGLPALSRILIWPVNERTPRPAPRTMTVLLVVAFVIAAAGVSVAWRDGGARIGWKPMSAPSSARHGNNQLVPTRLFCHFREIPVRPARSRC